MVVVVVVVVVSSVLLVLEVDGKPTFKVILQEKNYAIPRPIFLIDSFDLVCTWNSLENITLFIPSSELDQK